MKNQGKVIFWMILYLFMFLIPSASHGEWVGDVYLGMHSTRADDNSIKFNGTAVKTLSDSDTGSIFGLRIGYWFETYPWLGLAVDASASQVDFNNIDIGIGSLSTLLMFRLPLHSSKESPKGRIQPYLGVGAGLFYGGMSEFIEEIPPAGRVLDDTFFSVGIDARCGVDFLIREKYGVFLEYGFKRFSPTLSSDASGGSISLEPTFNIQTLSTGFTFRF